MNLAVSVPFLEGMQMILVQCLVEGAHNPDGKRQLNHVESYSYLYYILLSLHQAFLVTMHWSK